MTHAVDETTDPALQSWVPVPDGSPFPVQNLPFGVVRPAGERPRVAVAIGDRALDLSAVAAGGLFDAVPEVPRGAFDTDALNGFLAAGRPAWRAARRRISQLLRHDDRELRDTVGERALHRIADVELLLPIRVGDYVDFYSSIEHATNLGRMFRPDAEPLLPNWRHLPVGYHGRAGSVVASGTDVVRPMGQTNADDGAPSPAWGPTRMLDFELEVGFVTGAGPPLGAAIPVSRAAEHIFGIVLVNDWSARDIQRWEYVPLGPFLGKSFATSISPWVVTLDALEPYRVPGPPQEPQPLPYLRTDEAWGLDLDLAVELGVDGGRATISHTSFRWMYWTIAQQLVHASSNGAPIRPGDLFASGTVSGPDPGTYGSMIELTWRGTRPIRLPDGSERRFLEDGDTVVLRGWGASRAGRPRIGLGEVLGTVAPARPASS